MAISIILMEPEHPGNLGAIARAMANFGLEELVLVNPKCRKTDPEAKNRAKHAQDILKKAKVIKKNGTQIKKCFDQFDYLIATTAKLGTEFNFARNPLTAKELGMKLSSIDIKKCSIGILIGRESIGLKNEELEECDFVVTIPSHKKYSTLNISHACAILFYEIFNAVSAQEDRSTSRMIPATKEEKDVTLKYLDQVLEKLDFKTKENKETQQITWKRVLNKSMLQKREAFVIIGLWRKILEKIK